VRKVPFTRSLPGRLWRRRETMIDDWNARARQNPFLYICTTDASNEAEFWRSGERDVSEHVLDGLELPSDATVVEIGCGVGRLLRPLAGRVGRAIGVDISADMVARGKRFCSDLENVELRCCDGDLRGIDDAIADLVFSHIVFQHLPRRLYVTRYLKEALRVLKPGGVLRIQVDGRSRQFFRRVVADSWSGVVYSGRQLRRTLSGVGFAGVRLEGERTQYLRATARKPHDSVRSPGVTPRASP
jgi:SAM-dependent methyltransferase